MLLSPEFINYKTVDIGDWIANVEKKNEQLKIVNIVRNNLQNYISSHKRGEIMDLANNIRLCKDLSPAEKSAAIRLIYAKAR